MVATDALERSATVLWFNQVPAAGMVDGDTKRHFDRLADAVRFAMEEVPISVRGSARVVTDDGKLKTEEIKAIYRDLPYYEED